MRVSVDRVGARIGIIGFDPESRSPMVQVDACGAHTVRRRLNFTRRRRISQSDVSIQLLQDDAPPLRFDAQVSLDRYDLPPSANVFLEAYRRNSYMRFPWGTVSDTRPPGQRLALTDIDSADTVYFRVKVVGSAG